MLAHSNACIDENNYRQTYFRRRFDDQLSYLADAMGHTAVVPQIERRASPSSRHSQIAQVYQSGKTLAATGAIFGISRERVRQILAKVGVPSRRTTKLPRAVGDRVARLYQRGATIEAAAVAVGVSAFTARNMLVDRGIERRPGVSGVYRGASTRRRHESMARLYRQGHTFKELATAFDTSTTSVQRALNRLGIEKRGRGRSGDLSSNGDVSHADRQIAERAAPGVTSLV
jgi:hypothetical protein